MNIIGRDDSEIGISVTATPVPVDASFSNDSIEQTEFAYFQTFTAASGYYEWDVVTNSGVTISTTNPESTDLSQLPRVKRAATFPNGGTSAILLFVRGAVRKSATLDMQDLGSVTKAPECTQFKTGTVLNHSFDSLPADLSVGDSQIYRSKSTLSPVNLSSTTNLLDIELNPSCWAAGFDYSGVPVWNSYSKSPRHGMALITPRHVVAATHYQVPVGTELKFLGSDGNIYSSTVIAKCNIPSNLAGDVRTLVGDLHVMSLSSAMPDVVSPLPIPGNWITGAMQSTLGGYSIGCALVSVNQQRRALLGAAIGVVAQNTVTATYNSTSISRDVVDFRFHPSTGPATQFIYSSPFFEYAVSGDSGGAVMVSTSQGLVLASLYSTPIGGTLCNADVLNAMIASADSNAGISTGLTVTVAPDPTI